MKKFLALAVVFSIMLLGAGFASADLIQFPYVNSNPANLSTLVSVINTASNSAACGGSGTARLHYRYITKSVTASHTDACDELNFDRPTTPDDIVTFDFGGNIGSGLALFNDATSYAGGVGAPNFDLPTLGTSEPRRGYILVNHTCGGDNPTYAQNTLDGEAMLFDVVNGAAWNYAAVLANQANSSIGAWGFVNLGAQALAAGATTELLSAMTQTLQKLPIMPPSDINTRIFVTPQVIASNNGTSNNMSDVSGGGQKRTKIGFLGRGGGDGMSNRNEDAVSGGGPVNVRCVAGIDISDILGLAATTIGNEGGWAYVYLAAPSPLGGVDSSIDGTNFDHAAIVFKLEFGAPSWSSGSMFNAARIVRDDRIED